MIVERIVVTRELTDDGDEVIGVETDDDGTSLVTYLGMLEYAKDTLIRDRMGEGG